MKTLTLRGIDENTFGLLKEKAHREQKSMNQVLLEIIKGSFGPIREKRFTAEYDDLDSLFGRWTDEEFERVQGKISAERRIDQELWAQ